MTISLPFRLSPQNLRRMTLPFPRRTIFDPSAICLSAFSAASSFTNIRPSDMACAADEREISKAAEMILSSRGDATVSRFSSAENLARYIVSKGKKRRNAVCTAGFPEKQYGCMIRHFRRRVNNFFIISDKNRRFSCDIRKNFCA